MRRTVDLPEVRDFDKAAQEGRYRRYREYKPSEVDWISEIPASWNARRLRYSVSFPVKSEIRNLSREATVSFVPMETAKIDALVSKKRRLIELLQEKRAALISRAVTKGLNPDVPMKDSGIEWLGVVPKHWEVKALGHAVSYISYGFTSPMPVADEGPYMITANDVGDGHVIFDTARRTSDEAFETALTRKSRPVQGDILLTKDGTLGRVAVCDGTRLCINQSVALIRIDERVASVDFIQNALRASDYQDRMVFDAGGTTIKHIYITRVVKMPMAFPPSDEQVEICAMANKRRMQLDSLIRRVEDAIDRLLEYRTALISAAVTGKIDVRNAAAG